MQIFIKTIDGKSITIDVTPTMHISELKLQILLKLSPESYEPREISSDMVLIYSGKHLQDKMRLDEYGITSDSTVHYLRKIYGD